MNWKPLLVLAFLALPTAPLAGQTEAQLREIREREFAAQKRMEEMLVPVRESREVASLRAREARHEAEHLYRLAEEEAIQAREFSAQEREHALRATLEHAQQERVRAGREVERALAQVRERVLERERDIQQVRVRIRARVRIGVSLDGSQGEEYDSQGALVKDVIDDSPAEAAGLQEGDIITHLDGQSLLNAIPDEDDEEFDEDESLPVQRLIALAGELEDGEEVELRYIRDGASASVTFEAAEMGDSWVSVLPDDFGGRIYRREGDGFRTLRLHMSDDDDFRVQMIPHLEDLELKLQDLHIELDEMDFGEGGAWSLRTRPNVHFFGPENSFVFRRGEGGNFSVLRGGNNFLFRTARGLHAYGLELRDLNPDLGAYFSTETGVLVMEVDEDSTLGLQPGDVILSIGDREVEDTGDVFRILGSYEDEETVTITVMRHGRETQVQGTAG